MGQGKGGRGERAAWSNEQRGRSLGRHPENGEGVRDELTPYQELATEVGSGMRTRSQPPSRRPEATHPMTTRQGAALDVPRSQVMDDPHYASNNANGAQPPNTETHQQPNMPQGGQPGLLESVVATVSSVLTGSPPSQPVNPPQPTRITARDSSDPRDQDTDPSPNRTTLYESSPEPMQVDDRTVPPQTYSSVPDDGHVPPDQQDWQSGYIGSSAQDA